MSVSHASVHNKHVLLSFFGSCPEIQRDLSGFAFADRVQVSQRGQEDLSKLSTLSYQQFIAFINICLNGFQTLNRCTDLNLNSLKQGQ